MSDPKSSEVNDSPAQTSPAPAGREASKATLLSRTTAVLKRLVRSPEAETLDAVPRRRRIVTACTLGFLGTNFLMFLRFFFPRALYEPKTVFRIGYPSDFGFGVDTKFQKDHRIWVVRNAEGLFVIYARCTHLGCTPDWKAGENKFKCPCHGSGYDSDGINFEGPAPRPLDRAKVELDPEGQIVVDTSVLYAWPKGARSQFQDPGAFLSL
ncbi:MAG: Rieske 2Fe-2S domain-containing protein [Acidobacteriota bacterium]